ncbi:MAG: transglutaminase domain-containing protein [Actinomycetota bacterium]
MSQTTDETTRESPGTELRGPPPVLDQAEVGLEHEDAVAEPDEDEAPVRRALAPIVVSVGAAIMVGGIFSGLVAARAYAVLAAVLGGLLAYAVHRVRSFLLSSVVILFGVVAVGALLAGLVGGVGSVLGVGGEVAGALKQARLVRPPIEITPGFAALLGWLMAGVGLGASWIGVVVRRPFTGMLAPLPIAAITAISVPDNAQLASGILLILLFAAGLGIVSGDRTASGARRVPLAYEMRRAARAVPMFAAVTLLLVVLAQAGLLFPSPLINPEVEAQKPRTTPITEVPDRILFEVDSSVTGPWVMGVLDVYDGKDWRLPPFSQAELVEIPRSGIVDRTLRPGIRATVTVRDFGGAVLPNLPNVVGIVASGPTLNYDSRSGNIRLVEGEIDTGFVYRLAGAKVPTVAEVIKAPDPPKELLERFTLAPEPPPSAQDLIRQATKSSDWERWDFLRNHVLDNITSSGLGTPVSITPARIEEVLGSTKEASPFEIVAIQTLFARWVGLPARIGYGFDGGDKVGKVIQVRPKHGAAFPEVYFEGYGWIPVIGVPAMTKVSDASDPELQQFREGVLPSEDISVTVFRPVVLPVGARFYERARDVVLIVAGLLALIGAIYLLVPAVRKAIRRSRRRAQAVAAGPRARIVQAYSEWRDTLTDFGYRYHTDTPLMLLKRFPQDEEHNQLAWLVTRALWGDLRREASPDHAIDAEELSKSLRRRLSDAHPIAVRTVAALSRLSLRSPYSADADLLKAEQEPMPEPAEHERVPV